MENVVLSKQKGDVTGDDIDDIVYLMGICEENSAYIKNIEIVIEDGKSHKQYKISLKNNSGYNPNLFLGPFTDNKVNDIFVSIDSGGSGGYGFYYLYSFYDNLPKSLFDTDIFNDTFKYTVNYQDNYIVKVLNTTLRKVFLIDISMHDKDYLNNLYDSNGSLKEPTIGDVLFLNNLYPIDITGDGIYDLYSFNRIIGLYGADTLGYIVTPLIWDKNSFKPLANMQYVMVNGSDI